jgi:hypothetical protein
LIDLFWGQVLEAPLPSHAPIIPKGTIFEVFPYLLPNLVCTVIVLCGLVIGVLFLEETHAEKKHRHDLGLEIGKWVLGKVRRCATPKV